MQRELLKNKLPHGLPHKDRIGPGLKSKRDYTPVSWQKYFECSEDVEVSNRGTFRIYRAGSSGPVLFLLHGGGFSALTWSLFTVKVTSLTQCQVIALDIRGHGDTKTSNDMDLSNETLTNDIHELIQTIYPEDTPPIILIGHSMGGAIAINATAEGLVPSIIGLVVVDIVEGTALEALSAMQSFLKSRPQTFSTLEKAIEWSVRSGQIRNVESAKVSMQGQLVKCDCSRDEKNSPTHSKYSVTTPAGLTTISESSGSDAEVSTQIIDQPEHSKNADQFEYRWRIDLSKTEQFWKGWFNDMSRLFLSCPVPKLLIVAGRDRLDKELTVAHIQDLALGEFSKVETGVEYFSEYWTMCLVDEYLLWLMPDDFTRLVTCGGVVT